MSATYATDFAHGEFAPTLPRRIAGIKWVRIAAELDARGFALTGPLLSPDECDELVRGYDSETGFRSRVVMVKHGFGQGEYRYYDYPHLYPISTLRQLLYPQLSAIANRWHGAMKLDERFPDDLQSYLASCHEAGQTRSIPLQLRYQTGDYNCLRRDLYGDMVFPLQAAILLSAPGDDFTGGEFVLTEQRPRRQSRVEVVPLLKGEGVIFVVNQRPVQGTRGTYRVSMRHGVSPLRSGRRHMLGIIFHDAT